MNLDISLLALVYIGLGFWGKRWIHLVWEDSKKLNFLSIVGILGIVMLFWGNFVSGKLYYYFDMKVVYYRELISAIVIPCLFGIVLLRVSFFISSGNIRFLKELLKKCGKNTLPIMFMHLPLNYLKNIVGYGIGTYVMLGIGIPLLLSQAIVKPRFLRKLFGFPQEKGVECYGE